MKRLFATIALFLALAASLAQATPIVTEDAVYPEEITVAGKLARVPCGNYHGTRWVRHYHYILKLARPLEAYSEDFKKDGTFAVALLAFQEVQVEIGPEAEKAWLGKMVQVTGAPWRAQGPHQVRQIVVSGTATLLDSYYRVFYYVRGEHRERPYKHTTLAGSEEECRRQVLEQVPKAYRFEINRLDWPVEPVEPAATPEMAQDVDYSQEPGLPVEWKRPGQPSKKNRPASRKRAILGP